MQDAVLRAVGDPTAYGTRKDQTIARTMVGQHLRYAVCRIPGEHATAFPVHAYAGMAIFLFRAPSLGLRIASANNPGFIGKSAKR